MGWLKYSTTLGCREHAADLSFGWFDDLRSL
jgi:hypothetical protein